MSKGIRAVRGMNDVLPKASPSWREMENIITDVLRRYGYDEIRLPMVENSAVFSRSIGDVTDIVQKEMYTFADRNGDSLTLRPEGTAGCVRAAIEHSLLQSLPQRLWYSGPMFRHERPQRGRLRQFHQIGVEVFGPEGPDVDAELILLTARLWQELGLGALTLEVNSLGSAAARADYRTALTDYFRGHLEALDEDSRDRLERNPLRILDSKNPAMAEVIAGAPALGEYLDDDSATHFRELLGMLADNGLEAVINERLVRGLDYYSRTVFEWKTDELGAQGTVCAGGRYDGLVELMGGKPVAAIGFAMGLERLLELRQLRTTSFEPAPDLYLLATAPALDPAALALAEQLRSRYPTLSILGHVGGGSVKSRFKKADRSGARYAVVVGEDELERGEITVKPLRTAADQVRCGAAELGETVARLDQAT